MSEQSSPNSWNLAITCTTCGAMVGLTVAIYLGAFSSKEFENLSDWAAVLVSAIATGISFYAVSLVAQTLNATQETLRTTIKMAEDTKRIGDAQIRPWLHIEKAEITEPRRNCATGILIRNYGFEPATDIKIRSCWVSQNYMVLKDGAEPLVQFDEYVYHRDHDIAFPNKEIHFSIPECNEHFLVAGGLYDEHFLAIILTYQGVSTGGYDKKYYFSLNKKEGTGFYLMTAKRSDIQYYGPREI